MTGRADPGLIATALAEAATLGGYFTISTGTTGGRWQPAADVYRQGLGELIDYTSLMLNVSNRRIAASVAQLGYAARLWSPSLACALRRRVVPDLSGLELSAALPIGLRLAGPQGWQANDPAGLAALLYRTVVDGHLVPLASGLDTKIARGLLRGNAASALAGALRVIVAADPALAENARELGELLLRTGQLRGTGRFACAGLDFARRSCCLYYRAPGGAMCGDCSLLLRHASSSR